jgi:hypothetical protein
MTAELFFPGEEVRMPEIGPVYLPLDLKGG